MNNLNQVSGSRSGRKSDVAWTKPRGASRPRFLIGVLVCVCAFILPSCKESQPPVNPDVRSADTRKVTLTTPPFSTKEPNRYQAIRVTSFTETGSSENSSPLQSDQVFIARDGEKRREEYFAGTSRQIVYLEVPTGRFIVLPAHRLYADLSTRSPEAEPGNGPYELPENPLGPSPNQLLNETQAAATYEQLGTETLAGRTAFKYRVVVPTGADSENETLIWVDEALGIPIRSEAMSKSNGQSSKVTMELKDVKLEVEERLFTWPSDYRKVPSRVILDLIRRERPAIPK